MSLSVSHVDVVHVDTPDAGGAKRAWPIPRLKPLRAAVELIGTDTL
jgi:hypothetical protein